jgi:hypothetical protein
MLGRDLFVRSDRLVVRRRECRTIVRRVKPALSFSQRSKHFAQSPLGHAHSCRMQLIYLKRIFEKTLARRIERCALGRIIFIARG